LALSALMLVGPAAAQAHTDSYACTLSGATGSLNPPIPSIVRDAQAGTTVNDIETGTYTFAGGGTCTKTAGVSFDVVVASAGRYENVRCGTGFWIDNGTPNATVTDPIGGEVVTVTYVIDFHAGFGELTITDARSTAHSHDPSPDEPGSGSGVIDIVPTVGNCVTEDVTEFAVLGAFAVKVNDRP
jgi:hypothetical protein